MSAQARSSGAGHGGAQAGKGLYFMGGCREKCFYFLINIVANFCFITTDSTTSVWRLVCLGHSCFTLESERAPSEQTGQGAVVLRRLEVAGEFPVTLQRGVFLRFVRGACLSGLEGSRNFQLPREAVEGNLTRLPPSNTFHSDKREP